ncbi:hypothetical protein I7I50_07765 [Histoplasma capsulatum G186AR]|uniref:Uncharacterized protein n=1 Tax=Ajellomyces capsulatus TaxID=5037 RepID=A0A8H7YZ49_AJECA|nr:hypothetical protein I7I52_09162 [Histoplasma capsulatum]QSS68377.1 hypothetical protein I7I50_07765 [Histoplasma capsulatum G186AR]
MDVGTQRVGAYDSGIDREGNINFPTRTRRIWRVFSCTRLNRMRGVSLSASTSTCYIYILYFFFSTSTFSTQIEKLTPTNEPPSQVFRLQALGGVFEEGKCRHQHSLLVDTF